MNAKELLNTLVLAIVKESGSDIHLMSESVPVVRIHGSLIKIQRLSVLTSEDVQNVLKEMIDETKFVELHETKQVDFMN
jgi:Tfp pilus assembly pilus retraction ATPase PilT